MDVTTAHLAAARADGSLVVDVREPAEYLSGHVPGAVLMPEAVVDDRVRELPRDRPVYVICASGNRSRRVTERLRRRGVEARSVLGGTSAWLSDGRPVTTGPLRER